MGKVKVVESQENRKFSVAPAIIYSLIKNQAGTLAKAVAECVMNSVDAKATKITVDINSNSLVVKDNGNGFRTREEILECFEVFGFEHREGERVYGQFGIGRGQLWNFCSTVWRTNSFKMDVDIKHRGLDYILEENLAKEEGLIIEGKFYEVIKPSEMVLFENEFCDLVKYTDIPVFLNGKQVSKDPSTETWTHETPEAWIRTRENGDLAVYNLGILVRKYSSRYFGCGGVVVTKPGIRLQVNMARNDICVSECKVWKKIKPYIQAQSISENKTRMTDAGRDYLAERILAKELSPSEVRDAKVITDIFSRHQTVANLVSAVAYSYHRIPITLGIPGNPLAEKIHRSKRAYVLHPETLGRFNVKSVKEFMEVIYEVHPDRSRFVELSNLGVFENFKESCPDIKEGFVPIPDRDCKPEEKAFVSALDVVGNRLMYNVLRPYGIANYHSRIRNISIGVSDCAEAWTDGVKNITFNQKNVKLAHKGLEGWQTLVNILLHEYLHDCVSNETHGHDYEFYKRYHDITTETKGAFSSLIRVGLTNFIGNCRRMGLKLNSTSLQAMDVIGETLDSAENTVASIKVVLPEEVARETIPPKAVPVSSKAKGSAKQTAVAALSSDDSAISVKKDKKKLLEEISLF